MHLGVVLSVVIIAVPAASCELLRMNGGTYKISETTNITFDKIVLGDKLMTSNTYINNASAGLSSWFPLNPLSWVTQEQLRTMLDTNLDLVPSQYNFNVSAELHACKGLAKITVKSLNHDSLERVIECEEGVPEVQESMSLPPSFVDPFSIASIGVFMNFNITCATADNTILYSMEMFPGYRIDIDPVNISRVTPVFEEVVNRSSTCASCEYQVEFQDLEKMCNSGIDDDIREKLCCNSPTVTSTSGTTTTSGTSAAVVGVLSSLGTCGLLGLFLFLWKRRNMLKVHPEDEPSKSKGKPKILTIADRMKNGTGGGFNFPRIV